jgi:hypothetical protein
MMGSRRRCRPERRRAGAPSNQARPCVEVFYTPLHLCFWWENQWPDRLRNCPVFGCFYRGRRTACHENRHLPETASPPSVAVPPLRHSRVRGSPGFKGRPSARGRRKPLGRARPRHSRLHAVEISAPKAEGFRLSAAFLVWRHPRARVRHLWYSEAVRSGGSS